VHDNRHHFSALEITTPSALLRDFDAE